MSGHSPALEAAWQLAAAEAGRARHGRLEIGHLALGILSLPKLARLGADAALDADARQAIASECQRLEAALGRAGGDASAARRRLRDRLGVGDQADGRRSISRSDQSRSAFRRAEREAGAAAVTALDLMRVLLDPPDAVLAAGLSDAGIDAAALHRALGGGPPAAAGEPAGEPDATSDTPWLDRHGRDLTALARRGELGPVIGRRRELLRVLQVLARSSKSNPLLVGEPGVGKTAIVEALAIRAARGKDPQVLAGVRIVELAMGSLLGGTRYRGELEERLTRIVGEATRHPELVVFIDEIHTVVGAGQTGEGGMDAADILKPALARGELRCIGATTTAEYRRYVESDAALARRFERVDVPEPGSEETLQILQGLRERWQSHHGVAIGDDALRAAVGLSARFDRDRRLPDKAVDLVDEAAARSRIPVLSMQAPTAGGAAPDVLPAAAGVTPRLVAEVLAERLGLPVERVAEGVDSDAAARVLELEPFLRERLFGQDEAIARVASRLRLAAAGLESRRGPLAVFLLLGPSGVGKTELARLLAEFLSGSAEDLLRFDMSEYMEEHSVARLIGAPPGYVGHGDEGQLSARLRSRPDAVVLLDEAEKAHPRIFDLFLQVFDEGHFTDARGRSVDAGHALFALTSNLGTAARQSPIGFPGSQHDDVAQRRDAALAAAAGFFRPELLNRVDEVVVFAPLGPTDVERIAARAVAELAAAIRRRHGAEVCVDPGLLERVVREGSGAESGARGVGRAVERLVGAALGRHALEGRLSAGTRWIVREDAGEVVVAPRDRRSDRPE